MIPFQNLEVAVSSSPADVAAIQALGRSEQEAVQTARALAMCDAWLRRHIPGDADVSLDRQAFLARMAKVRRAGTGPWSVEATAGLVAAATNESLARQPLTKVQLATRDEQRKRVCDAVVETIALIERKSGVAGFAATAGAVEADVRQGLDKLLATPEACIGQVPISPTLFDELMSVIEESRDGAVLEAAMRLKQPVERQEMPDIAASAVADVLMDAVFDYARAAFLDGFVGRGTPLPFHGFSGGISGRFSDIRLMPSGELPQVPTADSHAPKTP